MSACSITKACVISLLLTAVAHSVYALENTKTYTTDYSAANAASTIYKTVDANGKVSYSQAMPRNSIFIEEIAIAPAPQDQNVEDNKARLNRIRETAEELTEAREKREAKREQEEKKRLERLALMRAANQPPYERKVYVSYPLWWTYPHPYKHRPVHHPKHYPGVPARKHGMSPQMPLSSGLRLR